jgi:hypothetical protein
LNSVANCTFNSNSNIDIVAGSSTTSLNLALSNNVIQIGGGNGIEFQGQVTGATVSGNSITGDLTSQSGIFHGFFSYLSPPPRIGHTMIFDTVRKRAVVFGGSNYNGKLNDVWALPLQGTLRWTRLSPCEVTPTERSGHVAVYDRLRDRMVVAWGGNCTWPTTDAWALTWGAVTGVAEPENLEQGLVLRPASPNPFQVGSHIAFDVVRPVAVQLLVYGVSGRRVRGLLDRVVEPGRHTVFWDGRDDIGQAVGPGVYFCTLTGSGQREVGRGIKLGK